MAAEGVGSSLVVGRICSVEGCGRKLHGRGLCSAHVSRLKKHGDVMADKPIGWRRVIVHGTYDGYVNHGCRCDECRKAHTDHLRNRPESGPYKRDLCACGAKKYVAYSRCAACRKRAIAPDHGTESRYSGGCRCDDCRRASRDARRRRRAAVAA